MDQRDHGHTSISPVGSRLRDRRIALGWTQAEMAQYCKVPKGWVSLLEMGRIQVPNGRRLAHLADIMGMDLQFLITGKEGTVATVETEPAKVGYLRRLARFTADQLKRLDLIAELAFGTDLAGEEGE